MTGAAELIPAGALPAWRALRLALAAAGPAPCERHDPEKWWPPKLVDPAEALELCGDCAVRAACFAYAVAAGEREGIWGGRTPDQRARGRR